MTDKEKKLKHGPVYSATVKEILENADINNPESIEAYLKKKAEEQAGKEGE